MKAFTSKAKSRRLDFDIFVVFRCLLISWRTEWSRKPKFGRMESHHTGNQWTYLEIKRSKVKSTMPINAHTVNVQYLPCSAPVRRNYKMPSVVCPSVCLWRAYNLHYMARYNLSALEMPLNMHRAATFLPEIADVRHCVNTKWRCQDVSAALYVKLCWWCAGFRSRTRLLLQAVWSAYRWLTDWLAL